MAPVPPSDHAGDIVVQAVARPVVYGVRQWSGWVIGPTCLLLTLVLPAPEGLTTEGWRTAGVAGLMAAWWMCETLPIPATALLPLVVFPLLGLGSIKDTAAPYANPLVFLFLGGFLIALAMQRWNLHRRLALFFISCTGTSPARICMGFLLAAGLVSMWVSNTATALMMFPIAVSVVQLVPKGSRDFAQTFGIVLMLAVAYGSTTGGMTTLIGTPPNALLAGFVNETYQISIGFGQWMLLGMPVTVVGLPVVYVILTRVAFRLPRGEVAGMRDLIEQEKARLGSFSGPEIAVTLLFALTALGWVFQPLLARGLPMLSDTVIGMAGALLLFCVPVNLRKGEFLMDWKAARDLPWDVLILFGGGLTLAAGIDRHGLAAFLGSLFVAFATLPLPVTMMLVTFTILLLTELTSNTATAAAFLPIAAAIAVSIGENPLLLLIPTALAANCAFMMPVGTPPNAIVFGSGLVTLPQMARTGFLLNLAFVPLIVLVVYFLGQMAFGIEPGVIPDWVRK